MQAVAVLPERHHGDGCVAKKSAGDDRMICQVSSNADFGAILLKGHDKNSPFRLSLRRAEPDDTVLYHALMGFPVAIILELPSSFGCSQAICDPGLSLETMAREFGSRRAAPLQPEVFQTYHSNNSISDVSQINLLKNALCSRGNSHAL